MGAARPGPGPAPRRTAPPTPGPLSRTGPSGGLAARVCRRGEPRSCLWKTPVVHRGGGPRRAA
ncbi:hypothetical protein SLNWT_1863 [Streptomyces albus]|uniref:Uncharacterized protein n=1 Tax=Streptomyces albus (strain ATCC 21838 / DSM 41398 / FERM P-419 / JCM 4703 / NBRC 107858) TaxID=1081613 RepID=A0A0B5EL39_STRA4|nr:hypothetical protein SLNWT_1863 [Streptomyces albus]AOU76556.1 hypothetical protein SLNHY_1865 [Streptomyces albus]AYN32338.1 hypothetical protein DUI70_1836 [Streptomyces albus]